MSIFRQWLLRFRKLVDDHLAEFFKKTRPLKDFPLTRHIYNDLLEIVFRAGRMSSALMMATYEGISQQLCDDQIAGIGSAIELNAYSILIHDDLFDDDDIRFKKDAYHILYTKKRSELGLDTLDSREFGRNIAIIGGNLLQSLAITAMTNTSLPETDLLDLIDKLNLNYRTVNESQAIDIQFEGMYPSPDDWYKMASKRAAFHTCTCIEMGGILAKWSEEDKELLKNAAVHLGYMFDIREDLFDTFSNRSDTLQVPHRDLKRQKKPLHICFALENASESDKKTLTEELSNYNEASRKRVIELLRECGLPSTLERFDCHVKEAKDSFEQSCLSKDAKSFFIGLLSNSSKTILTLH
ncbi:MAG: polyprenyl synthetase family protein [Candidatus Thorarchaeota archaeon]